MAPKKSKKEKQAEKEAELARLAEEQRLREEQEEKERQEEAALQAKLLAERQAAEAALQAELDERLSAENAENAGWYKERESQLAAQRAKAFDETDWVTFIECRPLPDIHRASDVNTFLTEWSEAPREGATGLDATLSQISLCCELLRALQLEGACSAARGDASQASWQAEVQKELVAEMRTKFDGATADFLQRSDEFLNAKNEVLTCVQTASCKFGLWVNLAKNPRVKSIEYAELAISSELPKSLALASVALRVIHHAVDFVTPYGSEEAKASGTMMSLGGTLAVELLSLPPTSKTVKGWTMKPITEMSTNIVQVPYPIPSADGSAPVPGTAPPLRIGCIIDSSVVLPESVTTVGYWDPEGGGWKTDGVDDIEWDPESRQLKFSTIRLTHLALLQPTHLELPYKNWLYAPTDAVSGELTVETARFLIKVSVSAAGCTLRSPDLPELDGLLSVPMPAPTLVARLKACGINLSPRDVDAKSLERVSPKDVKLEAAFHEALTPLLPRYQLTASRWNPHRGPARFIVRYAPMPQSYGASESDSEKPPPPPFEAIGDWPCLEYAKYRSLLISALDSDAQCDDSPAGMGDDAAVLHSSPLECLKGSDPELKEALLVASRLHQDATRQLFDELRLFSFTKLE